MSKMVAWLSAGLLGLAIAPGAYGQPQTEQAEQTEPPTIVVRGRAEVYAPPDLAVLQLGAVVQQPQANVAQTQVNQVMQRAITAINTLGIPTDHVQTAGITVAPVYTTTPPPGTTITPLEPRVVAYRASNAIHVRLDNLNLLGQVIDAAVAAGANQIEDLSFQVKDDSQLRQQALSEAARQARAKAQAIANALDVRLAGVREVKEGGLETIRPMAYERQAAALTETATPTPVQPGQVRVEASVLVTYQISNSGQGAATTTDRVAR